MANLFATKPFQTLMAEAEDTGTHTLKRTLGPVNLVMLGIGGIIGAGLFVRTAAAIADRAGPSVVLAFIVAGIGCAFAGLCYAEFASMIPVAGSAYTYASNEALNAGIPFTNTGKNGTHLRPAKKLYDYGFSVGGPLWIPKLYKGKNRTFIYFNLARAVL